MKAGRAGRTEVRADAQHPPTLEPPPTSPSTASATRGNTSAFGLSGYWQPERSGWIHSISTGWGFNNTNYASDVDDSGLVANSQSWSVGLQWQDVFSKGHVLGMAVGQPTFATRLHGGETPRDGNGNGGTRSN